VVVLGRKIGFTNQEVCFGNKLFALATNKNIESRYVYYYYYSETFQKHFAVEMAGIIGGVSMNKFKDLEISLPPLPEQQRIVDILDDVFTSIAKVKANAEQNLKNAKELFESYLQGVFENGDWERKKWGDLCEFVRGPFGGSLKKNIFKEDGYVVYEQKHAIHDHFNQLRYFIDEDKFNEMKRFELFPGDIIMSCSGVTLGKVAIVPECIKRGIINQALLKLTPKKNVSVHFIKHWLRSSIFSKNHF
jgi:type I restriction enzyme S subunit